MEMRTQLNVQSKYQNQLAIKHMKMAFFTIQPQWSVSLKKKKIEKNSTFELLNSILGHLTKLNHLRHLKGS